MAWEVYYEKNINRNLRPLYLKAIQYLSSDDWTAMELGCGVGTETLDLLKRGFNVTAIDQEPKAIEFLLERCQKFKKNLQTKISKFENIQEWPKVDFLYAFHSLPFCNETHFDEILVASINSVRKKGLFVASFFGHQDDWMLSKKCVGIEEQKIRNLLNNFEIIYFNEIKEVGNTVKDGEKMWHVIEIIARQQRLLN